MSEKAQISWISLVLGIGLDPADLLTERKEQVLKALMDAAGAPPKVSTRAIVTQMLHFQELMGKDARLAEAAFRAITTLSFVAPAVYVNTFLEQIRGDLDPSALDFVGLEERGIWATPPDQLFVDGESSPLFFFDTNSSDSQCCQRRRTLSRTRIGKTMRPRSGSKKSENLSPKRRPLSQESNYRKQIKLP
jgi:hypothetical protein